MGIAANLVLALFKLAAGIFGHSRARVADAVESSMNNLASLAVYIGLKISSKPADQTHPHGHGKAEPPEATRHRDRGTEMVDAEFLLTTEPFMSFNRTILSVLSIMLLLAGNARSAEPLPAIRVSANGRHFVNADGSPFFWLGDTAWGIFNHAGPEEVDVYLDDRASKGFTVIQGVIALWDYRSRVNPDGQLPFLENDLGKINEAYFKNVDSVLDKVEAHGMRMAILPFWSKNFPPVLRDVENQRKMKDYHAFLARRYAKRNLFWTLGGDASGALEGIAPYTDLMADGLIEGAKAAGAGDIMITYHPTGRQSSSFWFHEKPWLAFDSIQSGHFINTSNFQIVAGDYAKMPAKPTIDMEPGYENITDRLVRDNPNATRISADDVRRSAYLAVMAGAAGHTYGNGEVYEFWAPEKAAPLPGWGAGLPWRESLKLPGSSQMQFLRYLIESRPMLVRIPDQSMLADDQPNRALERAEASRAEDGGYAMIYTQGAPVKVNLDKLSGQTLRAWWYDPRTGTNMKLDEFEKTPTRSFTPPAGGEVNDWVLVIDDASRNYPPPGTKK